MGKMDIHVADFPLVILNMGETSEADLFLVSFDFGQIDMLVIFSSL